MTSLPEVAGVVASGVDAVGFIFAGASPRKVDHALAREIIKTLPPFVDAVGVFVDEEPDVVNEIVQYCGLTMVQLHGAETPDYCARINSRLVKAFRIGPSVERDDFMAYQGLVSGFLLDTYHSKMAGGTGETFDWRLLEKIRIPGPIILAGGLTPANVGDAVRRVRPFAVDLNSGVEVGPGRKDLAKVRLAVEEVARADRIICP
jgi:phosphoribosylanthranilate isomerase